MTHWRTALLTAVPSTRERNARKFALVRLCCVLWLTGCFLGRWFIDRLARWLSELIVKEARAKPDTTHCAALSADVLMMNNRMHALVSCWLVGWLERLAC